MRTAWWWAMVLALASGLTLPGCKAQPTKSQPETKTAAPEPEPDAPEPTCASDSWQWPLGEEKLAELRALPVQKRNEMMRSMIPPVYEVRRATGTIKIDGSLDEDDWVLAPSVRLRDVGHGTTTWYGTTVRVLYDDANLYVAFKCDDSAMVTNLQMHDDPLWKEDSVEVMIDSNGDEKGYTELMVSAANVVYDAVWADFRADVDWMKHPTWERFEMDSPVKAYDPDGVMSAVKVNGTLNGPDDTDEAYMVEMAIPWTALREVQQFRQAGSKIDMTLVPLIPVKPPKAGTVWRMNFLRNNPSAPLLTEGEISAWSPTGGSIHVPSAFGRVRFVGGN